MSLLRIHKKLSARYGKGWHRRRDIRRMKVRIKRAPIMIPRPRFGFDWNER